MYVYTYIHIKHGGADARAGHMSEFEPGKFMLLLYVEIQLAIYCKLSVSSYFNVEVKHPQSFAGHMSEFEPGKFMLLLYVPEEGDKRRPSSAGRARARDIRDKKFDFKKQNLLYNESLV